MSFILEKFKLLNKYEQIFLLKTDKLIINWVPYKQTAPERLPSQSDKI